ncbi:DUF4332 domain-containing protein [candidate division WOR-3 bacterium]|uniref:DUF4332 domain-containing protein n=1 Tax=candidate division WOR-3 bacterium TaxID=2052148 RepID=A0A9D5QDB6_UNCW3|nr:DUF4332 domain-containing protein [candidate division WOR-3 bacterium]MBD3364947.1 DUF4332 domain-containing protein [candidate division WOR-3 bacterium]
MTKSLERIEGIGKKYAVKLKNAGIRGPRMLLSKGLSSQGRKEIAKKAGVSDKLVLEWVNHCDLFRVKGVGSEYADLLEAAGVDTVPELGKRNPENLHSSIIEANNKKKLVRKIPTNKQVKDWVSQAKRLPRKIEY